MPCGSKIEKAALANVRCSIHGQACECLTTYTGWSKTVFLPPFESGVFRLQTPFSILLALLTVAVAHNYARMNPCLIAGNFDSYSGA
jgi:hypothetical protein